MLLTYRRLSLLLLLSVSFVRAEDIGTRFALLVGVQDYTGTDLSNLRYCENDAHGLGDALIAHGYTSSNITLLTQRAAFDNRNNKLQPTARNIKSWLATICRLAQFGDTVLVGLGGHGVQLKKDGKMYFCAQECNLGNPETLIPIDDVYAELEKSKASVKLLFVDACRNDPLDGRTGGDDRVESLTRPQLPEPPGGIAAFFSCSKGQRAFESDELKHGVFFNYVIDGLNCKACNGEGQVTVATLEDFLTREVPRRVVLEKKNPELFQTPERVGRVRGAVVLALAAGGAADVLDLGNGAKLELVKIPAGSFDMGSPPDEKDRGDDEKQHRVTINKDFYMGKYHVTVGQFRAFVRAENYKTDAERGTPDYENGKKGAYIVQNGKYEFSENGSWMNPGFNQGEDEPVVCVSWNDAQKFVEWLSRKSGRKVRLPSEAEWEYACRAGTTTPFNTGETISTDQANYNGNYTYGSGVKGVYREKTTRVGSFKANAFGLYDMHGNAWQLCQDSYRKDYENLSVTDPVNNVEGMARVLRGGSWILIPYSCRSAYRLNISPDCRYCDFGFRVVVSLD